MPAIPARIPLRLTALFVVLAAVCLTLPWWAPVHGVRSDSYALGFSNSAFLACVLLFLILPAWVAGRRGWQFPGSRPVSPSTLRPHPLDRPVRITAWTIGLVAVLFLLAISRYMTGYGEAEYFLLRAALIEAGKTPYHEFEYAYGPLMIYGIVFLKWLGVSAGFSQWLLVIGETLLGYAAVRYIAGLIFGDDDGAATTIWFALFLATCFCPGMGGQNYTYFRFAGAMALSCWALQRSTAASMPAVALLAGPIFLLGWVVSPEVGAAVGLAFGVMAPLIAGRRIVAALVATASLAVAIRCTPGVVESFETILQFSKGGNNLPAYPAVHVLLFLGSIFLSTLLLAGRTVREHRIEWALFVFSVCMLPGALGRCDYAHVVFYGFGFFILAARYVFERAGTSQALKHYAYTVGIWFFLLAATLQSISFVPVSGAIAKNLAVILSPESRSRLVALAPTVYRDKATRALTPARAMVFDAATIDDFVVYPQSSSIGLQNVRIPYFVTLQNATTAGAFDRLAGELNGHDVFVPSHLAADTCGAYRPDSRLLSVLFLFPTRLFPQRNSPDGVAGNFCAPLQAATVMSDGGPIGLSKIRFP